MIRGWLQPCFFSSGEKRSLPTRSPVSEGIPQVPKLGHSRDFETALDSAGPAQGLPVILRVKGRGPSASWTPGAGARCFTPPDIFGLGCPQLKRISSKDIFEINNNKAQTLYKKVVFPLQKLKYTLSGSSQCHSAPILISGYCTDT